jgi:hypothetical protein
MESGANPQFGLNGNVTVMVLDDGVGSSQPQAAAPLFRGEVRLKNLLQMCFRHADAPVGHGYLYEITLG